MNSSSRTPWLTLVLVAANLVMAFALLLDPDWAVRQGFRASQPSLIDAVVSLFLHLNVVHLLGNLLLLVAVGSAVESAVGSLRFASIYFVGGIAGAYAHALLVSPSLKAEPLIGASGAVAACAGYAAVRFLRRRVPLGPGLSVPVGVVVLLWAVLQGAGALVRIGEAVETGVAFWSHLGGLLAGLILAVIFSAPLEEQRELGGATIDAMRGRSSGAALAAAEARLAASPTDAEALSKAAQAHREQGETEAEVHTLLALVETRLDPFAPDAATRLGELSALGKLDSRRRAMLAEQWKANRPDAAQALLRSVVAGPQDDPQRPDALIALAGLVLAEQPEQAGPLLAELRARYPLHPATEVARVRGWI